MRAKRHRHRWTKSVTVRGQRYCEGCSKFKFIRRKRWVIE